LWAKKRATKAKAKKAAVYKPMNRPSVGGIERRRQAIQ